MPTIGRFTGQTLKLFIDLDGSGSSSTYAEVGCATSHTLNLERAMIDTRCKDDGDFDEAIPSVKSGTLDLEGFVIYDNTINHDEFFDMWDNGTRVKIKVTTDVQGDPEVISDAYLTSFSESAAIDEVVTYSLSFRLVGTVTNTPKA